MDSSGSQLLVLLENDTVVPPRLVNPRGRSPLGFSFTDLTPDLDLLMDTHGTYCSLCRDLLVCSIACVLFYPVTVLHVVV